MVEKNEKSLGEEESEVRSFLWVDQKVGDKIFSLALSEMIV